MNNNQMRVWLYDYYKSRRATPRWLDKIKRMPDKQIFAIYKRLQEKQER